MPQEVKERQNLSQYNPKNFNFIAYPDQRHGLILNASISMQMSTSANVDYLPLVAFCRITFPAYVMTLFAPVSCLSNIEPLVLLMLWSICLNRIKSARGIQMGASYRIYAKLNFLCILQTR